MIYDKPYEDGLYFGKGGLRMGSNFHVDSQGNLYAISGEFAGKITSSEGNIAGWKLSDSSLTGGSMTIKSNGSMSGKNWSITADGKASFSNANISGGTIGDSGGSGGSHPRINPTNTDVGPSGGTNMNDWCVNQIHAQKAWIDELIAKKITADYIVTKIATVNKLEVKGTIIASSLYMNSNAISENRAVREGGGTISGIKTTLKNHTDDIADIKNDYATENWVTSNFQKKGATS